jgi:tRNA-uridine 2-sulfurtransferase
MRIVVAMSGGVDSSVAAALLAEQGHEVIGLSMQVYDHGEREGDRRAFGSCCALDDLHDARRVAAAINIPHYILNFERRFDEEVVSNFVREYAAGRTPLPCAHCNSDLKFAALLDRARGFGADAVATGHYARIERDPTRGRYLLKRSAEPEKDQSYFLFSLTQDQLARAVFPVGEWSKQAVRDYARRRQLPVADKPDSQEICFIPDDDYASFVAKRLPDTEHGGDIVDASGLVLGRHGGIHRFTIGQRRGLGLTGPVQAGADSAVGPGSGPAPSRTAPLYVLALRPDTRQVVVGPKGALERSVLTASGVNWIAGEPCADASRQVTVQIRYRHRPAPATVRALDRARAQVIFDAPQIAVTPGQAVVWYDEDVVVGGGWID